MATLLNTTTAMATALLLASPSSLAAEIAVLGYKDAAAVEPEAADRLADDVRAALPLLRPGDVVVDTDRLRTRMRGPMGEPTPLVAIQTTIAAADAAANAVEHERAVGLLESAIGQLEADTDFSLQKRELLQDARLKCARLLLGLAGPGETGKAESPQGKKATKHLENALRIEPTLVLDVATTPPKLRALLGLAQERLQAAGHGGAAVVSTPPGVTVYLDGRALGLTPMTTAKDSIPRGRYRLWLASTSTSARSFARVVDVGELPIEVDINVTVEGALDADRAGLVTPLLPLNPGEMRQLAMLLGVDDVVVVGVDGGQGFVVDFDAQGKVVRSGAIDSSVDAAGVAAFVAGQPSAVTEAAAPAALYTLVQPVDLPAESIAAVDDFVWLAVGIGAGVVVAAGATAAVLYFTRGAGFDLTLTEQP